ncbi:MAG: PTS sugar transporter subunit IIC [Erysipelotrichaceae bacterium]
MFTIAQIIILPLVMFCMSYDLYHSHILVYGRSVFSGFLAGLVMGDVQLGLVLGGTLELMSLGVTGIGGSSVPNYPTGTIMGTAFAVASGGSLESGLAVGIPVAALGVQLDVLAKMSCSYILHKAESYVDTLEFNKMYTWLRIGILPRTSGSAIAVLLAMTLGANAINTLLELMPAWLSSGLSVAGNVLPAVGFAILLRFMPLKKYFVYALLGFTLTSFMGVSIIGIAVIGFIIAYLVYVQSEKESSSTHIEVSGGNYDE